MKYVSKKYADYSVKESVTLILQEIVKFGVSGGWCGSFEKLEEVQNILKKYNVMYTDDMFGEWKNTLN